MHQYMLFDGNSGNAILSIRYSDNKNIAYNLHCTELRDFKNKKSTILLNVYVYCVYAIKYLHCR